MYSATFVTTRNMYTCESLSYIILDFEKITILLLWSI